MIRSQLEYGGGKTKKKKIKRGHKYYFLGTKLLFWKDKFIKQVYFKDIFKYFGGTFVLPPQDVGPPLYMG
jgi:hypothetical protein